MSVVDKEEVEINHNKNNSFVRSIYKDFKKVCICLFAFILLFIAIIAIIEAASRISARNFLSERIQQEQSMQTKLLQRERAAQSRNIDEKSDLVRELKVSISNSENRLRRYNLVLDDMQHLEISGSSSDEQTLVWLRSRVQNISSDENRNKDRVLLRKEMEALTDEAENIRRIKTDIESNIKLLRSGIQNPSNIIPDKADKKSESSSKSQSSGQVNVDSPALREKRYNILKIEAEINELTNAKEITDEKIDTNRGEILDIQIALNELSSSEPAEATGIFLVTGFFAVLPTDILIALALMCSGAVGSAVVAIRSQNYSLTPLFLGLIAGFAAFLLVKGGRFFFFVNAGSKEAAFLNPYALAFTGLVAGMFTDRIYSLLDDVAEAFSDRAKNQLAVNSPDKPQAEIPHKPKTNEQQDSN